MENSAGVVVEELTGDASGWWVVKYNGFDFFPSTAWAHKKGAEEYAENLNTSRLFTLLSQAKEEGRRDIGELKNALSLYADPTMWEGDRPAIFTDKGYRARKCLEFIAGGNGI